MNRHTKKKPSTQKIGFSGVPCLAKKKNDQSEGVSEADWLSLAQSFGITEP